MVNWSCKLNSAISDIEVADVVMLLVYERHTLFSSQVEKIELTGRQALSVPDYDEKVK